MALDSGIAKMGLFAFIFLVVFAGLLSLTPNEFAVVTKTYGTPQSQIPEAWNGMDLVGYNFSETWNTTLTWYPPGLILQFDIGDRNLELQTYPADFWITNMYLTLSHQYGWGLQGLEIMYWYDSQTTLIGDKIYADQLDDYFTENEALVFTVLCEGMSGAPIFGFSSYFKVTALFSFNQTAYTSPSNAWFNDELDILFGINPENSAQGMDIWFLISSLLTFNTVEVFGNSGTEVLILNGILAALFFAPIVIFAAAVLLEVLPF